MTRAIVKGSKVTRGQVGHARPRPQSLMQTDEQNSSPLEIRILEEKVNIDNVYRKMLNVILSVKYECLLYIAC